MVRMLPKSRGSRAKEAILRGVYEENLKMIGKGRRPLSRKEWLFSKFFVFFSTILIALLGQWSYLDNPLLTDRQITGGLMAQAPSPGKQMSPSDFNAFFSAGDRPLRRVFGLEVKTIMIDPGHGGSDPGTIGRMGTKEKDITLDIAKRLKERLKKSGNYHVILTREEDVTLPLNKRVELARSGKADIFVSIHLNYLPSKPINIIETYYFGPSADAKTLELAEKENVGSRYVLSDFRKMIEKLGETMKLQESRELAAAIQRNLFVNSRKENGNVRNFGVKRAPFVVLLGVDIPAVLAEVSCLSNSREEIELNTENHREDIARYIEAGILNYLNKGEVRYEAKRNTEG